MTSGPVGRSNMKDDIDSLTGRLKRRWNGQVSLNNLNTRISESRRSTEALTTDQSPHVIPMTK